MLANPFVVFILSFGMVLLIYQLGWSELYLPLSYDVLLFFATTFLSAGLLARFTSPAIQNGRGYVAGLLPHYATWFVIVTFVAEILLAGGVPILLVLGGKEFYTQEANAVHLHAFTFWIVFSTIRFADFIYSRNLRYLIEAGLPVLFFGLLIYRGSALMCLASWAFIFVICNRSLRVWHAAVAGALAILIFYGNGVIGDIRSPQQEILIGEPTKAFKESVIPRNFFWSYLYSTVSIANLQLTVDLMDGNKGTVAEFVASEFLPDTISKRVLPLLNDGISSNMGNLVSRDQLYGWEQPQVSPGLNISTIFGRSYGFFGWLGPAIMFVALCSFIVTYLILIRSSPYRVPALALLNTLVLFCLFNNMLVSAATLPTLIWPLLLPPWKRSPERATAESSRANHGQG
ncbi:hypothetical protein [Bradyrhizobium sp.]|uniref:hypothetical protein n=1 Tax=Bradyrhizobium sp. TaxID=376 RepID=UPI00273756B3|nr:hypothetical protein [Bradyrhizobium sp.]MDP3077407.1 hypothetical protein [Bradyrhizobium sp.]